MCCQSEQRHFSKVSHVQVFCQVHPHDQPSCCTHPVCYGQGQRRASKNWQLRGPGTTRCCNQPRHREGLQVKPKGSVSFLAPTPTFTMQYSNNKEVAALVRALVDSGWRYMNGKKHGKIISPNGRKLAVPGTPSDWRASMNFQRGVRRLALIAQS